ncbi:NusA-like transcription termination signal-binding factor [Halorhabdus sp. CBA1104]|uniref:NusA-like transcription termination signal-binding factor n=1 Tax=unclassified Halorhabdus TaxID=2621901 RepID=UPI0012B42A27|nr:MULTISPECIES: NusA-like transcription termination signal-binding factor [unclassified Halorhabdus]QGN06135.1 NusA-like transcription termination signal-binding factor [Halorhabdus sp. CBA1104]
MTISLSDEQRRAIAIAEDVADVTVRDCVFDDEHDHVGFVIKTGEIGKAIGRDGETVDRLEQRLGQDVTLVEDADRPAAFLANAFAPAAIEAVTIEDDEDGRLASVDVDDRDIGIAIGADGRKIELVRELAARHFDFDEIELTEA